MTVVVTNVYSPNDGYEYNGFMGNYKDSPKVRKFARMVNDFINLNKVPGTGRLDYSKMDVNKIRGVFEHKSVGKRQRYRMTVLTADDALFMCALLEQRNTIDKLRIPAQLQAIYKLYDHSMLSNHKNTYLYRNDLLPWIKPKTKGRAIKDKVIINPTTDRFIKVNKKTYKDIFGKIRLKKVYYEPLHNFNTIDYEIKEYCVPSYLEANLLKKEFKIISDDLKTNLMPTYPELTEMLNKIDYNLNVYTHDGDIEQEQSEHKKTITIIIHDEHMYVTNNKRMEKKITKTVYCNDTEFENIKTELYTESTKIHNGIKYKLNNKFCGIEKEHNLRNTFSNVNIDFFNECGIRPVRYFDVNLENAESLDVNACYPNILYNSKYIFPVQDGTEKTEKYDKKNDTVQRHGFYYVTFKKMDDIQKALFSQSCWMIGEIIISKKLEKKIDIKFKHITSEARSAPKKPDVINKMDLTFYSGYLAKYKTQKSKIYECNGDEAKAYLEKYKEEDCFYRSGVVIYSYIENKKGKDKTKYKGINYETSKERDEILKEYPGATYLDSHIELMYDYYLKSSGMYAYLSILQYARLQLYNIYDEVIKKNPDIKIKKIYTDSITFDKKMNIDLKKLNDDLSKKHNFTVKYERSEYQFEKTEIIIKEPIIEEDKELIEHDDLDKLLCDNKSFSINARAGYGKTYTIKNKIIPYLNENLKKYILASTTIESTNNLKNDGLECEVINSILLTKESHFKNLSKKFKDINYFIVDESSRLSMNILKVIEHLKETNENLKIILVGDKNQCDYDNKNLMESDVFNKIIDYNNLTIKWHKNARYSKEYDTFLNDLLKFKNGGYDEKCIDYIKAFFKEQVKNDKDSKSDKNEIKLTFTNNKRKSFEVEGMTTHKAQGKTIDTNYSIYEIRRMNVKVLYTSFSRCSNHKLINIYI